MIRKEAVKTQRKALLPYTCSHPSSVVDGKELFKIRIAIVEPSLLLFSVVPFSLRSQFPTELLDACDRFSFTAFTCAFVLKNNLN